MHTPRKRFGQNFLQDQMIIHSIIQALNPRMNDNILEIGPGLGALTTLLLEKLNLLKAIEIDNDLYHRLSQLPGTQNKLQLFNEDALKFDYQILDNDLRIVGNLPYNISTPLLICFLQMTDKIKDMHFMLQEEVVDRLVASPGNKTYGRLSVMAQHYCEVTKLFTVPPHAFYPKPKVNSAIVRLKPIKSPTHPDLKFSALESLVAKAFSMRRKTIANNLKPILTTTELIELEIDPQCRPEQISVIKYAELAQYNQHHGGYFV